MPKIKAAAVANQNTQIQVGGLQLGFAIDESDSMASLTDVVIEAFNSLLAEQAAQSGTVDSTVIVFSSQARVTRPIGPLDSLLPLSRDTYRPHGGTALLDGLGLTIQTVAERFDAGIGVTRAVIAILTDGLENSSHTFSMEWIQQLVNYRTIHSRWIFLFLGPRRAVDYAIKLGFAKDHILEIDNQEGTIRDAIAKLGNGLTQYRLGNDERLLLQ